MEISVEKLKDLVVKPGHISEQVFDVALKEAKAKNERIEEILVEKDLINDDQIGRLMAESLGFRFVNLKKEKINENVLQLIPELVARSRGAIVFARDKNGVKVGMRNPGDLEMKHFIEKRVGQKIIPYFITERDLQVALPRYRASIKNEFDRILSKLANESLPKEERDEITVEIVNTLLTYGYESKASDIHIEPYLKRILIRFRIDGVMHDVLDLPKNLSDLILTRIKILAKMRTDEHRAAQDGKLRFNIGDFDEIMDVRVSSVPVTEGENVVMRLLSSKNRQFGMMSLGLSGDDFEKLKKIIKNPHGMILVTGPTGSGKTTTLYAVMKILNTRDVHISTIEDPVEYDIEGISQIQVNTKTDLTFAKGLRAIVRQDPDIIMVGEVRDQETAEIAVNSAMTGHLVLSTIHANDAATTLPRLLDMGIEPFLISSTVNAVIAQRLVRKICEKCRISIPLTDEEKKIVEREPSIKRLFDAMGRKNLDKVLVFTGTGCEVCGNTGYIGRIGIFEILEMVENVRELILKRASSDEIMKVAHKNGMTTMLEDGIDKIFNGVTTLNEVIRVTRE